MSICPSYEIWRAVVWGSSTYIMLLALKRFKCPTLTTFFFIGAMYALSFYKLRGSLGISILIYGLSFILQSKRSVRTMLTGIALIVASYFFHKSMPFTIAILILTMFIKFSKCSVILSLLIFPVLTVLIEKVIVSALADSFNTTNEMLEIAWRSGTSYASKEANQYNIIGVISNYVTFSPSYLILYFCTKSFVFRRIKVPKEIWFIYKFSYVLIYISSLFFFQVFSTWIYIRFLTMAYLPVCIIGGYYFKYFKMTRGMKLTLYLCAINAIYNIAYPFYKIL